MRAPMDRQRVIQTLMDNFNLRNYLEIGVNDAHILFKIKSKFKIAVDPDFKFSSWKKFTRKFTNTYNIYNKYYEKTSDAVFAEDAPGIFKSDPLQLAFVDGMHEYGFALRDIENSLKYLTKDGAIVVHDCNPQTKEAEGSFADWKKRGYSGTWNGDVWKSILHIRSAHKDLTAFVLDADQGVGVIVRRPDNNSLNFTPQQIEALTFEDFDKNRREWLNLKPWNYFYEFFNLPVPTEHPRQ
jgi:hypothetical protein